MAIADDFPAIARRQAELAALDAPPTSTDEPNGVDTLRAAVDYVVDAIRTAIEKPVFKSMAELRALAEATARDVLAGIECRHGPLGKHIAVEADELGDVGLVGLTAYGSALLMELALDNAWPGTVDVHARMVPEPLEFIPFTTRVTPRTVELHAPSFSTDGICIAAD